MGAKFDLEFLRVHGIADGTLTRPVESLGHTEQVLALLEAMQDRITELMMNWIRVGFCQGLHESGTW